jgi:hypothetical protein
VGRYWGIQRQPEWAHHAVLDFAYGGTSVDPRDRAPVLRRVEQGVLVEVERQPAAERAAIGVLEASGFHRATEASDAHGLWLERADPESWIDFMQDKLPDLAAQGWRIEIEEGFHFRIAEIGDWEMDIAEGEGGNWLDVGLGVEVDGQRVDLLPLLVELIGRYQVDLSTRRSPRWTLRRACSCVCPTGA